MRLNGMWLRLDNIHGLVHALNILLLKCQLSPPPPVTVILFVCYFSYPKFGPRCNSQVFYSIMPYCK